MLLLQSHKASCPAAVIDTVDHRIEQTVVIVGEFSFAYDVLRHQRAASNNIIMVVLPAGSTANMTASLLNAGADDVVHETITDREWQARLRAKLRWLQQQTVETLTYGRLSYRPDYRQVTVGVRSISLSVMRGNILEALLRRPQGMNHAELESAVYRNYRDADRPLDKKVMDVQVHNLNKALYDLTGVNRSIETIWGRGRRLSNQLKSLAAASSYTIAAE